MRYFNLHTHQAKHNRAIEIQNLYQDFQLADRPGYYSIGLHPWHIEEGWLKNMEQLKNRSLAKNVVAIGECGLDRICKTDFVWQQQAFEAQLLLANEIRKPVIIHCVRAYEEVFQLLKLIPVTVPVLFHGFNKHIKLAEDIISKGFYLSFGKALQKPSIRELVAGIPMDRLFLETDDSEMKIEEVYQLAADACSIDIASLILQVQKNAAAVFGADTFSI